ncbi:MAG TPA: tyrosine-protein phosphatase [Steroidobacteraceae bacterium]|nr:tyrosine-protein phosphatase [Steroidobacteraceae bacterium]
MNTVHTNVHTGQTRHGQRTYTLEGGCNFRDLGGYSTLSGKTVRWGKIFRTGVLTYLTDADHALVGPLDIRAICDLRRAEERHREPTQWRSSVRQLSWDDGAAPPTIRALATKHPNTAAGMRSAMIDLYRVLPSWMAPRLRGMFDSIDTDEMPLIVHCAAGKDRTGIAIGLLLAMLGVSRDTIVEDYLLTNQTDFQMFIRSKQHAQLGLAANAHPLLELPDDVRKVLFAADADYLLATFEQLDKDFGGAKNFLETHVGVTAAQQKRIADRLLA